MDNILYLIKLLEKWNEIIYAAYLLPICPFLSDSTLIWGVEGKQIHPVKMFYFPASLIPGSGHVIQLWPMKCKQKSLERESGPELES